MSRVNYARAGESAFQRMEKVNSELLAITYGSMVTQLIKDFEHVDLVNEHLEKMGYNIGIRIIDEFLAKSGVPVCADFRESAEALAKVAFKMFLGVSADITNWNNERTSFSLILPENPLNEFVELPPSLVDLHYSNIMCGIIRGAFEQIRMKVSCGFEKDVLKGDSTTSIKVTLVEIIKEMFDDEDS